MDIYQIIQLAIILLVSIWLHEYAHAYVSYRLGDPTPKLQWRLTPNPIRHLDPIWFVMVFLIWFWRGKPVQINPMYYKNPIKWEFLVAMAWPAANIILSIIWIIITFIYMKLAWLSVNTIFMNNGDVVTSFWVSFALMNITLAIFNLIPIPPLDGFRIIKMIWWKIWSLIEKYTMFISIFFLIILLGPGSQIVGNFLSTVSFFVFKIFFTIIGQVFY